MKKYFFTLITFCFFSLSASNLFAQLYWGGAGGAWNSAGWSTSNSGPYTTAWTNNSNVIFNVDGTVAAPTSASNFLSLTCNANISFTSFTSTIGTNGTVANINVVSGKTFDFGSQGISATSSTGFIKDGGGTLALSGSTYGGGFTLNNGTVVARGVNTFGQSATNNLIINGGTIACDGGTSFAATKFAAIVVNSNFTIGSSIAPAVTTSNISFASPVSLGSTNKTITINGTGLTTLSGIIGSTGGGLTTGFGSIGTLVLSGANTYAGPTNLSGGTLTLGAAEVIPNSSAVIFNGGMLKTGAYSETYSTLNLLDNSSITLNSSIQTHNFIASNAVTWISGKTLTITGWAGGYNSTAGAKGQIFVGNNASGLTAQQLSQIKFFNGTINYDAIQLSTGEVVPSTVTLPISLVSFTGKEINKSILLNWETSSEKNNKTFKVLRSRDGKSFKTITSLNGAGNSDSELKYSFTDENPYGGTNYYQLKQIDFDGKSSTSKTIAVDSKVEDTQIAVYANTKVNVSITSPNQTEGNLILYDMNGKALVTQNNIILNKGFNQVELNKNLNAGIYFIILTSEGKHGKIKFIK